MAKPAMAGYLTIPVALEHQSIVGIVKRRKLNGRLGFSQLQGLTQEL